jgi:hypothetical protein
LWDIVNLFNLGVAMDIIRNLVETQLGFQAGRADNGANSVYQEEFRGTCDLLFKATEFFKELGFQRTEEKLLSSLTYFADNQDSLNVSIAETEIRNAKEAVLAELGSHTFLVVNSDREDYVDNSALFGISVYGAFPSARDDIREAGNCLAAECCTAAVFHLMRAAEYALRALAVDRRVKLRKNAILDLATWEEIIKQLEGAEVAIQGYPKTLAREAQFDFYHGAMMEFKRFKNKFRNRIMHTRDEYDRDQAHSAFVHVRDFMKILASRISETRKTPLIWKGKKWITVKP